MSGFRIWALQDLSYILSAKSLQHEAYMSTNVFKRCLTNLFNSSRKQENAYNSGRIILSTISKNLEPIFTWTTLPEITTFNSQLPTYFFKTNTEITCLLKPGIEYDELLDGNPVFRSKSYKTLSNIQAGDFGFLYNDNTVIKLDKVYYDDCSSKAISTLQENQQPRIDYTIEQVSTDDLSTCTTVRNMDSSSKLKLKTSEIQQQQSRDLSEISQQLNMIMKTQGCAKDAAKLPAFSKIDLPRNIPLEWSSKEGAYPREEYHTWKLSKIENDATKCDRFLASDIRTMRQEQSNGHGSSRFDHLVYSGSSGNQGFPKSSLCLLPVSRRMFSSRSCTTIQQSIREIKNLRKDLSANTSIVRLKNTQSYPDRVSLAKLQLFSHDASRSTRSSDCEKDDKSQRSEREDEIKDYGTCSQEVSTRRCQIESKEICGKKREKDTCEKRQESKSKSYCKSYTCPELERQMPCKWDAERCPEARQKCDTEGRATSRNRTRQSRDSNCLQEQEQYLKSYKQYEDCEESDKPRAVCKDLIRGKDDCELKCEKRRKKRISEKERRKCTGSSRKRSNSCRRKNSSRASDKSCSKVDGRRRYSQQSIISVPQDRKSFSTLIPDIVLDTINKTTKRFYASCSKGEKDRKQSSSCDKRKRKCRTKEKAKVKKKCVKGPAKCISRKKTTDKMQTCQSTQIDKHKKACKSTEKSNYEKYCTSRKKAFMKDEKFKAESVKVCTSATMKDKKSKERSIKQQVDREYKEIEECKKNFKKEKKDDKAKMVSVEYKPTGSNGIRSYKEEQDKNSEIFASTPNKSIILADTMFKWFNIQSRVILMDAKDVRLFNVMSDRSFSTAKLDYQNDFPIERTMNDSEMARNCTADNDDFIHGDELPNYVEIEYENEEDDTNDWATIVDPVSEIDRILCKSHNK